MIIWLSALNKNWRALRGDQILFLARQPIRPRKGPKQAPTVPTFTLGIRLTETDRFGSSVIQTIRFRTNKAPIGSRENLEPRYFGFGYFGSVSVLTEWNRKFQKPTNSSISSKFQQHFASFWCSKQG